jgi:hypothetical protein
MLYYFAGRNLAADAGKRWKAGRKNPSVPLK